MKKRKKSVWYYFFEVLLFILQIPYYIVKYLVLGLLFLINKTQESVSKKKVESRREDMKAVYKDFEIIKAKKGKYAKWINKIYHSDSKIGIILGARGSGKTGFALKFLENLYTRYKKRIYAIGFHKDEMPSWIDVIESISLIKNNSFVLIDEGGVLFSSRKAMSSANKLLSDLILVARHKNLSILFISQNSSNLDVNILRQADFLVLKPSSLLQKDFERKIVRGVYSSVSKDFENLKDRKGLAYIYSDDFQGFVSNSLPSFWTKSISKAFR